MRVLLINPPSPAIYQVFMPLGLASIAGCLLRHGHEVTVWDINAERWSKEAVLRRIRRLQDRGLLVGITSLGGDYPYVNWLCGSFRTACPETQIVIGGHLASALPRFLVEHLPVDFVAVGEGEETMVELAGALDDGKTPASVRGLWFRDPTGRIVRTPERPRLKSLGNLPLPPWDLFPMEIYLRDPHPGLGCRTDGEGAGLVSIMASRGCPFDCIYCDHTVKGYRPRYRPVESVLHEMEVLLEKYGDRIKVFYFWDDILIWDRRWVHEFCEGLTRKGLQVQWTCNGHVNRVDRRLAEEIKSAGCVNIRFGIESGSQRILDALNKGVRVERALTALRTCLDAGLSLTLYIMVGMTGENDDSIRETVDFFRRLIRPFYLSQIKRLHFFMLTPFVGTKLFDRVRAQGRVPDLEEYLHRACDAYYDIPLNISGRKDHELLRMRESLESGILGIFGEETNRLYEVLFDMYREAAVGIC